MKKALAILMVLALVASAVTAEVTVSGWGRGIFAPIQDVGGADDNTASVQKTWDGRSTDSDPRTKFSINGNSDNVGFQFEINSDGKAVSHDGVAKIWVKPVSMVNLVMGYYFEDTLRGNADFGSFNWLRAYGGDQGEDITFTRISSSDADKNWNSEPGFLATIRPVDPLFIAVNFADAAGLTEDLFDKIQMQVGYTIENVGLIRAQYYSQALADGADIDADGTIEVAFRLTMIENLSVDMGFRMFTNDDGRNANEEKDISMYAKYGMDALTIHGLVIYRMLSDDDAYNFAAGVDYSIGDGLGVEADVRYYNDIWNKVGDAEAAISFFAGVKKGFSNGLVGVGLEVQSSDEMAWALPVRMEYWF